MNVYTRKVGKMNESLLIHLPKKEAQQLDISAGDELEIVPTGTGFFVGKSPKQEQDVLFTIGYEGLSIVDFIERLLDNKIEQVIDVREIALSRKNGFSKGLLRGYLKEARIEYRHYSELGSPRNIRHELRETWDYKTFFKEFEKHVQDEDVQAAILDVAGLAKVRKTTILCFEKDSTCCHRSTIAKLIAKNGFEVKNL
jgi:uncharacterized protein (DUF488 family)